MNTKTALGELLKGNRELRVFFKGCCETSAFRVRAQRGEWGGVSVVLVVVLSSVISAVIGVFGLLVSERERRKGSAWGA